MLLVFLDPFEDHSIGCYILINLIPLALEYTELASSDAGAVEVKACLHNACYTMESCLIPFSHS